MSKIVNLTLAGMVALYTQGGTHKETKAPEIKFDRGSTMATLGFGNCVNLADYLKSHGVRHIEIPYNDEVKLRISRVENIGDTVVIRSISAAGQPPSQTLTEICFNPEYKGDLDGIIYYIRTGDESKIPKTHQ